jgi:hypothetical protein
MIQDASCDNKFMTEKICQDRKEVELDWITQPGRTPVFQCWMDSLEDKKVKLISTYLPAKLEKNWSTNRR